jgi:hypothetical protein
MKVLLIAAFLIETFPVAVADAAMHRHEMHVSSPRAPRLTADSVNAPAPQGTTIDPALIVKAESLLDRDRQAKSTARTATTFVRH